MESEKYSWMFCILRSLKKQEESYSFIAMVGMMMKHIVVENRELALYNGRNVMSMYHHENPLHSKIQKRYLLPPSVQKNRDGGIEEWKQGRSRKH